MRIRARTFWPPRCCRSRRWRAIRANKLVFTAEGMPLFGLHERFPTVRIGAFTEEDYEAICASYLGAGAAQRIDYGKVHRFAPKLNARQLRDTCVALRGEESLATERFVDYLREHHLASNVDIAEVQAVDLRDLKGLDDTLEALEANVIMPLENADVSQELGLQPKRGVLLAGPPGTGKTTIGRALARRLKSKFFLLDGTVISGTPEFFPRVHRIFEAARQNAPCRRVHRRQRRHLRERRRCGALSVSADDAGRARERERGPHLPDHDGDGRRQPAAGAGPLRPHRAVAGNAAPAGGGSRARSSAICAPGCRRRIGDVDVSAIAAATEGLAGADLKRVVEDGKLLFAFDREKTGTTQPTTTYFLRAVETVRRNKEQYAEAEARARARRPVRPSFFDAMSAMSGFHVDLPDGVSIAMPTSVDVSVPSSSEES